MSSPSDVIIFCEGYDDRSFWKGLLHRLHCTDEKRPREPRFTKPGIFCFRSPDGRRVYLVPAPTEGKGQSATVLDLARDELSSRVEKPFARLVLNMDIDVRTVEDARRSVITVVQELGGDGTEKGNDFILDDGRMTVSFIPWFVEAGSDAEGVPAQQALERLVCAALSRVYPERAKALSEWLRNRPGPAGKEHKAHAWSFYAGWYTAHGTGFFYESLWNDNEVAGELENLLRAAGTWETIEAIVGGAARAPGSSDGGIPATPS